MVGEVAAKALNIKDGDWDSPNRALFIRHFAKGLNQISREGRSQRIEVGFSLELNIAGVPPKLSLTNHGKFSYQERIGRL